MRSYSHVSNVFKDTVTITLDFAALDDIIYTYGLVRGSFQENEELVIGSVDVVDQEKIVIEGFLYQEGMN